MVKHMSSARDSEPDDESRGEERTGDYMMIGLVMVLLVGVLIGLALNPDESKLKDRIAFEEPEPQLPPASAIPRLTVPVSTPFKVAEMQLTGAEVAETAETIIAALEPTASGPALPESVVVEQAIRVSINREMASPEGNHAVYAWAVNLASFTTQSSARRAIDKLKSEGVVSEFIPVNSNGRTYYRIRIPNLSSKQQAEEAHALFMDQPAYKGAWINRYRRIQP